MARSSARASGRRARKSGRPCRMGRWTICRCSWRWADGHRRAPIRVRRDHHVPARRHAGCGARGAARTRGEPRMADRGEYRAIHVALIDDPDFLQLSPPARLALMTLKLILGVSGIDVVRALVPELMATTGYDEAT